MENRYSDVTWDTIKDAIPYGDAVAKELNLIMEGIIVPSFVYKNEEALKEMNEMKRNFIPVDIHVRSPWEYSEF